MDFNALIAELRASSENLPNESADRSLLSSVYCNKACKALDQIADGNEDYENVITGMWLIAAHFAEQLAYVKPVPALSELCFKLFRQCAKAVLNIQWQNLEDDSSLKQNFLVSLANLHAKLVPFDFPRFRLLEALTENPWTNPTLAKIMGGEVEDGDKEEVRLYIEREDPIILQLRVDMMLKENCEEYALNLCNSCLSHPELQSDLSVRKTQLSLLYSLGQEDKLQEECQKLSIQDAVRIIKQLQTSKTHRKICTVLAQTFMVQNWIRPSDMEANKELLRLWIRQQLLVDREQDQFKDSVWAMAKLSQSTEQIVIFIDVLREECGDVYLQLYVDMCIFAINVDKGQMETSMKEGNLEAASARRSDMASVCAKLSCLCHHTSIKVARICALTSFALKPSDQSLAKIGTFYGQGTDCCNKCGVGTPKDLGIVNPATLYEVERLLNMLRPEYLNPDQTYANIQILCRRFLQESLRNAQQIQRKQHVSQNSPGIPIQATTQVEGPGKKKPTNLFEALSIQDVHNNQLLLNKMKSQSIVNAARPAQQVQRSFPAGSNKPNILQHTHSSGTPVPDQAKKGQYNKQPYGAVPPEQQHQYYLVKAEKEQEQKRKTAQQKRDEKLQPSMPLTLQPHQQNPQFLQQQQQANIQQPFHQNKQVAQIIETALRQDSTALQKLTQNASPEVVNAVLSIMKGTALKSQQQSQQLQQQINQPMKRTVPLPQPGSQPLPTVSTLLKPSGHLQQQQPPQVREQPPPRRYPRPQLYAQPIIVSTSNNLAPMGGRLQPSSSRTISGTSRLDLSGTRMSSATATQEQRAESFKVAKNQAEDIRRFMQMQMSNLQQKQIAETRQMSGSTVTLTNAPVTISMSSVPQLQLSSRPKTTVELAQEAAQAKLMKQNQQAKQGAYLQQPQQPQLKLHPNQVYRSQSDQMLPRPNQQPFINTMSRNTSAIQTPPSLMPQQNRQGHLMLPQQNSTNNVQNQAFSANQNLASVLPASDELSGSIMGIDDTIIKELLEDSGILANTFPDIEVETVTEDKTKKAPDLNTLSLLGNPPASRPIPGTMKQVTYSTAPGRSISYTMQCPTSIQHTQNFSSNKMIRPVNSSSASSVQGNLAWPSGSDMNKYPSSSASGSSLSFVNSNISSSTPQFIKPSIPSSQPPIKSNFKPSSNVLPGESISLLPNKDKKVDGKFTMDQLRELMKKEDIQGEVTMDAANNATYRCIICSLAFETLDNLREHVRNVCKPGLQSSSVYNTKIKQDRANSAKAGLETTTVFQCLRCFELCVSDNGIKQHRLVCKRVPTVPSDIKTEPPKSKSSSKSKLTVKTETKDTANKIHGMSAAPSYPQVNTKAVLKTLSMAGPVASSINKSQPQVTSITESKPITPLTSSFSSFSSAPQTTVTFSTGPSNIYNQSKPPPSVLPASKMPLPQPQHSICTTLSSANALPAKVTASSTTNITVLPPATVTCDLNKPKNTLDQKSEVKPKEVPPPSYSEISGSGGSKFYKCKTCLQTLCSMESFLVHWRECYFKNESLLKRRESREKLLQARTLQGETLEHVLSIIAAVASGDGEVPDFSKSESGTEEIQKLCALKNPASETSGEGGEFSEDSNPESWRVEDYSGASEKETEHSSESEVVSDIEGRNRKQKMSRNKKGDDTGEDEDSVITAERESGDDKKLDDTEEDEDDEEDDNSLSESERNALIVPSREAPPKLRDRKTLKPIQSFINETFISPYDKTGMKTQCHKEDGEEKDEERTTSGSEVDSDGESLYCKVCKSSFKTKRILLQHYAHKHLQPYTVKTVADSSSYFCHLCQKTYSTFMHYMQHVPNHSVTIYEKMKAFISNIKSSQHSERIASQRGFTRTNRNPKMVKALKSKRAATKSAVDRLKRQILAGNTQSMREKLRMSKRKKSLSQRSTSSEDDCSSDASNNVVFKSKKSSDGSFNMDIKKPQTRRVRELRSNENRSRSHDDESSIQSSSEEQYRSSRRAGSGDDDDYTASDDSNSDEDRGTPPTTRSRKRSNQLTDACIRSKRRRTVYDDETSKRTTLNSSDFDTDSNSTTLLLSEETDGNFVPVSDGYNKEGGKENSSEQSTIGEAGKELPESNHSNTVIVRSISKKQKAQLTSCDLHPTIVLHMLSSEDIDSTIGEGRSKDTSSKSDSETELRSDSSQAHQRVSCTSPKDGKISDRPTSAPIGEKKPSSFLDSFLSYLNQYNASPSEANDHSARKRNRSGPPGIERPRSRTNSLDAKNLISSQSGSPAGLNCTSNPELESSNDTVIAGESDSTTLGSKSTSSGNDENNIQSILSKFPTRRCSVNLGEKINLDALKAARDIAQLCKAGVSDRPHISSSHSPSLEVSKAQLDGKAVPVVCLERNINIDMYMKNKHSLSAHSSLEKGDAEPKDSSSNKEISQAASKSGESTNENISENVIDLTEEAGNVKVGISTINEQFVDLTEEAGDVTLVSKTNNEQFNSASAASSEHLSDTDSSCKPSNTPDASLKSQENLQKETEPETEAVSPSTDVTDTQTQSTTEVNTNLLEDRQVEEGTDSEPIAVGSITDTSSLPEPDSESVSNACDESHSSSRNSDALHDAQLETAGVQLDSDNQLKTPDTDRLSNTESAGPDADKFSIPATTGTGASVPPATTGTDASVTVSANSYHSSTTDNTLSVSGLDNKTEAQEFENAAQQALSPVASDVQSSMNVYSVASDDQKSLESSTKISASDLSSVPSSDNEPEHLAVVPEYAGDGSASSLEEKSVTKPDSMKHDGSEYTNAQMEPCQPVDVSENLIKASVEEISVCKNVKTFSEEHPGGSQVETGKEDEETNNSIPVEEFQHQDSADISVAADQYTETDKGQNETVNMKDEEKDSSLEEDGKSLITEENVSSQHQASENAPESNQCYPEAPVSDETQMGPAVETLSEDNRKGTANTGDSISDNAELKASSASDAPLDFKTKSCESTTKSKERQSSSQGIRNSSISLAAFIAERLLNVKEEEDTSTASSPDNGTDQDKGCSDAPVDDDVKEGDDTSTASLPDNSTDQGKGCGDAPVTEDDDDEGKDMEASEVGVTGGALGLVDYSSSDGENDGDNEEGESECAGESDQCDKKPEKVDDCKDDERRDEGNEDLNRLDKDACNENGQCCSESNDNEGVAIKKDNDTSEVESETKVLDGAHDQRELSAQDEHDNKVVSLEEDASVQSISTADDFEGAKDTMKQNISASFPSTQTVVLSSAHYSHSILISGTLTDLNKPGSHEDIVCFEERKGVKPMEKDIAAGKINLQNIPHANTHDSVGHFASVDVKESCEETSAYEISDSVIQVKETITEIHQSDTLIGATVGEVNIRDPIDLKVGAISAEETETICSKDFPGEVKLKDENCSLENVTNIEPAELPCEEVEQLSSDESKNVLDEMSDFPLSHNLQTQEQVGTSAEPQDVDDASSDAHQVHENNAYEEEISGVDCTQEAEPEVVSETITGDDVPVSVVHEDLYEDEVQLLSPEPPTIEETKEESLAAEDNKMTDNQEDVPQKECSNTLVSIERKAEDSCQLNQSSEDELCTEGKVINEDFTPTGNTGILLHDSEVPLSEGCSNERHDPSGNISPVNISQQSCESSSSNHASAADTEITLSSIDRGSATEFTAVGNESKIQDEVIMPNSDSRVENVMVCYQMQGQNMDCSVSENKSTHLNQGQDQELELISGELEKIQNLASISNTQTEKVSSYKAIGSLPESTERQQSPERTESQQSLESTDSQRPSEVTELQQPPEGTKSQQESSETLQILEDHVANASSINTDSSTELVNEEIIEDAVQLETGLASNAVTSEVEKPNIDVISAPNTEDMSSSDVRERMLEEDTIQSKAENLSHHTDDQDEGATSTNVEDLTFNLISNLQQTANETESLNLSRQKEESEKAESEKDEVPEQKLEVQDRDERKDAIFDNMKSMDEPTSALKDTEGISMNEKVKHEETCDQNEHKVFDECSQLETSTIKQTETEIQTGEGNEEELCDAKNEKTHCDWDKQDTSPSDKGKCFETGAKDDVDESDDLSDFDLVIEKDTSSRNVLSFPRNEPRNPPKAASFTYITKTAPIPVTTMKTLRNTNVKPSKSLPDTTGKPPSSATGGDASPMPRKPLRGAKAMRKGSEEQFVWDIDEDDHSSRRSIAVPVAHPLPVSPILAAGAASYAVDKTALDVLIRKQKALREKVELPSFTDWDDLSDTCSPAPNNGASPSVPSASGDAESIHQLNVSECKKETVSVAKVSRRIPQRKRPLTPDIPPSKTPAKIRRTSSLERRMRASNNAGQQDSKRGSETDHVNTEPSNDSSSHDLTGSESSNSIPIDEDISFKKDSFTPPIIAAEGGLSWAQSLSADNVDGLTVTQSKRRSKRSHLPASQISTDHTQECKTPSPPQVVNEDTNAKNVSGLRSRHNSVESNKSDKSVSSKRSSENTPHSTPKRSRKSEDPLTPRLKKAGLIKINKDSTSPQVSTGLDTSAPMTRSSEAAMKAFNQKSLRNRGVNPVSSARSSAVNNSKSSPGTSNSKISCDGNSKSKTSAGSAVKVSPLLSTASRHSPSPDPKQGPSIDSKTEQASKGSSRKLGDTNNTAAVVKRRAPPGPAASRGAHTKTAMTGKRKKVNSLASTTVICVHPPESTASRGTSKSQTSTSSKGTRTIHTTLAPGTASVKPKKDSAKQAKWKINKETKIARSKKHHKGPLTFNKRT